MFFDILLVPFDSYWHKKYVAMEREHKRSESNLRYSESIREDQEADLSELSKKDWMQAQAIRAFHEERAQSEEKVNALEKELKKWQGMYNGSELARIRLAEKLDRTRQQFAEEMDNRDQLLQGMQELRDQLAVYKELCDRRQADLDTKEELLEQQTRAMEELRAQLEALTHEDGGEALAG